MSFVDPVGRSDPAPVPTPAEHKPSQTPPSSAGDPKPDANTQGDLPGLTPDPNEQPPDPGAAEQAAKEAAERRAERKRAHQQSAQERINEAFRAQRAAERQRDELVDKVLRGELKPEPKAQTSAGADLKEPREEDFKDYGEFLKARDDYLVERTRRATAKEFEDRQTADERKRSEEREQEMADAARKRFDEGAAKLADQYEDFDEVMDDLFPADGSETRLKFMRNNAVARFVFEDAERSQELVYHLANNPAEAKRIAAMTSPTSVAAALTRLELNLPKPQARTVTNAPRPPKEIKGGGSDKLDEEKMSIAQMRAAGIGGKRKVDY